jgi:uncharacterized tellurite resistance protein B-like protein
MADDKFTIDLAKLLIAAAWADGELQNEEINSLKDLIFTLEDINAERWAQLEIYMDSPVNQKEREFLLNKVLDGTRTQEDKILVIKTLERMVQADGVVGEKESEVLEELKNDISSAKTGVFSFFSTLIKGSLDKRNTAYRTAINREENIDDYIKNTIYYQLVSDAKQKGIDIHLPNEMVRKVCLAAGLMAKIAAVDSEISKEEKEAIKHHLSKLWQLSKAEAELVTEISCSRVLRGLDSFRLTRSFFECTNHNERRLFLAFLFQIANACNKTSHDEIEKIRRISDMLKLSHQDFIAAKITISDEDLGIV